MGPKNFDFFQQIFRQIFEKQAILKKNLFSRQISEYFDFFLAISQNILISQAKLAIYSCFWANYYISLQKSPHSNILPVHYKIQYYFTVRPRPHDSPATPTISVVSNTVKSISITNYKIHF